ncbi:MAG: hypothetical protein J3K34DRAFT_408218 [Monoraphidium minutum]|nr:MAG: hypothetical protein J3K34DRAFT_408218 [Monoraphidium minutum]
MAPAPPPPCAFGGADDLLVLDAAGARVPHNTPAAVEFETELFTGRLLLMFRVAPRRGGRGAPECEERFRGKQRLVWAALQGRFKRAGVALDDLKLGSEWGRPLRLPAPYVTAPALAFIAARMGGGLEIEARGASPRVLSPLIAAAQVVHVAPPGREPADPLAAHEDTRLLLGDAAPPTAAARRALFRCAAARRGVAYSPDHAYTFQIYDHTLDYSEFRLPYFKVDIARVLDGQPMGFTIKDFSSGATALDLRIWHRRLLDYHPPAQPADAPRAAPLVASGAGERVSGVDGGSSSGGSNATREEEEGEEEVSGGKLRGGGGGRIVVRC